MLFSEINQILSTSQDNVVQSRRLLLPRLNFILSEIKSLVSWTQDCPSPADVKDDADSSWWWDDNNNNHYQYYNLHKLIFSLITFSDKDYHDDIEDVAGDDGFEDVAGDDDLEYIAGDADLEDVAGDADLEDVAGDADLEDVNKDDDLEGIAGDDDLEDVDEDDDLEDVAGDINIDDNVRDDDHDNVRGDARDDVQGDNHDDGGDGVDMICDNSEGDNVEEFSIAHRVLARRRSSPDTDESCHQDQPSSSISCLLSKTQVDLSMKNLLTCISRIAPGDVFFVMKSAQRRKRRMIKSIHLELRCFFHHSSDPSSRIFGSEPPASSSSGGLDKGE